MNATDNFETKGVIEMVRKINCLWDPTCPDYKNFKVKHEHWSSIASTVIPKFADMGSYSKIRAVERVQKRWKTARREYKKTLLSRKRTKYGYYGFKLKKYLYYDLMKFLYPHIGVNVEDMPDGEDNMEDLPGTTPIKVGYNEGKLNDKILAILNESSKTAKDGDYAFFKSILPMVGKLKSGDKLNFRRNIINRFKEIFENYEPIEETNVVEITWIPLEIKKEIIQNYDKGSEIFALADEYGIFTNVISDIIDNRVYHESVEVDDSEKVTTGKDLLAKLEEFISDWMNVKLKKKKAIPLENICEKATKFYNELMANSPNVFLKKSYKNFEVTEQWVKDFITERGIIGENLPILPKLESVKVEDEHPEISSVVMLEMSDNDDDHSDNDSFFESYDHPLPLLDMYGKLKNENPD